MDGEQLMGNDRALSAGPDVKAEFEAGINAHLDVLGRFIATGDEASPARPWSFSRR